MLAEPDIEFQQTGHTWAGKGRVSETTPHAFGARQGNAAAMAPMQQPRPVRVGRDVEFQPVHPMRYQRKVY